MSDEVSFCQCCDEPPCEAPWLQYISRSATCSTPVCGEVNPADGKRYMVVTTTHIDGHTSVKTYTLNAETGACTSTTVCSGVVIRTEARSYSGAGVFPWLSHTHNSTWTRTRTYNEDCSVTTTYACTGSSSYESDDEPPFVDPSSCNSSVTGTSPTGDCTWSGTVTSGSFSYATDGPCLPSGFGDTVVTVSPEPLEEAEVAYTSLYGPDPCTLTFPEWPEWGAGSFLPGQGAAVTALRDWSDDELTKSERVIRYRINHRAPGLSFLRVWIRETYEPDDDEPTTTDRVYTYTGGLPDPTKSYGHANNIIAAEDYFDVALAVNGTARVEILKWSCVIGYEPTGTQPSGYPDPLWEAA